MGHNSNWCHAIRISWNSPRIAKAVCKASCSLIGRTLLLGERLRFESLWVLYLYGVILKRLRELFAKQSEPFMVAKVRFLLTPPEVIKAM